MEAKSRKKVNEIERRHWPRLQASSVPFLKSVTLSQGTEVAVMDISRGGMLLESEVRLQPQMKILLRLVTSDGDIKLEGSVVRSFIASLAGAPKYRSAIAFEHPFHMLDDISEETAASPFESAIETGMPQPQNAVLSFMPIHGKFDESTSVMTFVTPNLQAADLENRIKANNW
jgi:hypothetical protein